MKKDLGVFVGVMKLSKQKRGEANPFIEVRLLYKEAEYSLFTGGSPKVLQAFELHIVFCWLIFFFLHLLP